MDPNTPPLVCLRKYPDIVHTLATPARNYSGTLVETLKAFSWVDRARLRDYLEGSKFDWTPAELGVLAYVLQEDNRVDAFTSTNLNAWQHRYEEFMPDLIRYIRVPEFAQDVHNVVKDGLYSLEEAEAIVAIRKADELLWKFSESIKPDLAYNEARFKDYKTYTLYVGSLCRDDDKFIGRMTAWDRSIKATGDNSFMVVTVWEPGKPTDTHQYYLVKE